MNKKIIFLSPHPDDIEFFCGGTLAKLLDESNDIYVYTFSHCEESVPIKYHKDILIDEFKRSMNVAGVKYHTLYDFKVRRFNESRQDILELLVKINNEIKPDIVFLPSGRIFIEFYDMQWCSHTKKYAESFKIIKLIYE